MNTIKHSGKAWTYREPDGTQRALSHPKRKAREPRSEREAWQYLYRLAFGSHLVA